METQDIKIKVECPEYKSVEEKTAENYANGMAERYEMIKGLMFKDGGYPQGLAYLSELFRENFKLADVLQVAGRMYDDAKDNLENNSIVSLSRFHACWGKPGHPYGCLDKDLKFCVRIFGEGDWSDILYVFPYMNPGKAYDVSFKYDV